MTQVVIARIIVGLCVFVLAMWVLKDNDPPKGRKL